ncbi:MAG: hypothetical protein ACT4N2_08075 [Hyphomicrobium sp.]
MTALRPLTAKQLRDINPAFALAYPVASETSARLADAIERARFAPVTTVSEYPLHHKPLGSIDDQLYTARAQCKVKTNQFAMHFGVDWQRRFFSQLDALMNKDDWDAADTPVTEASFTTLIRLLLIMRGKRRPGLGLGNGGRVIAAWTNGADRLTIECLPEDRVRWIVSQVVDGDLDTAAGDTTLALLFDRLAPFNPGKWFADEGAKSPA